MTQCHRRATGLKVAVEVADDYAHAGPPLRSSVVAIVSRPKISKARGIGEGGVVALNYTGSRPRWRCVVPIEPCKHN
jgi:hypothetical protein